MGCTRQRLLRYGRSFIQPKLAENSADFSKIGPSNGIATVITSGNP
jgi:hypothetical protein